MLVVARLKILAGRAKISLFQKLTEKHNVQLMTKLHQMRADLSVRRVSRPSREEIRARQRRILLHQQIHFLAPWAQMTVYMCIHALHVDTALRLHKGYNLSWNACHIIARFCRDYLNDLPVLPMHVGYAVAKLRRQALAICYWE